MNEWLEWIPMVITPRDGVVAGDEVHVIGGDGQVHGVRRSRLVGGGVRGQQECGGGEQGESFHGYCSQAMLFVVKLA